MYELYNIIEIGLSGTCGNQGWKSISRRIDPSSCGERSIGDKQTVQPYHAAHLID